MKLEDIGFYTLSDNRAQQASMTSLLHRCELILTDRCNFKCGYCRGAKPGYSGDLTLIDAMKTLHSWFAEGLKNVRFSGGEPTLYPQLHDLIVQCRLHNVERIALSTNGSAKTDDYLRLCDKGVNDFSISLDACCSSTSAIMSGIKGMHEHIMRNINVLSELTYVTVGVVLTDKNAGELLDIVRVAQDAGVSDIRIISAAQWDTTLRISADLPDIPHMPIYTYRLANMRAGRNVRGIKESDTNRCPLVLDDMAVNKDRHFPCIIYMREHGEPIGVVGKNMRREQERWFLHHDTHLDRICKMNCLDVCVDYNNRWEELHAA